MYTNMNNGQTTQESPVWENTQPHRVKIIRFTKARLDKSGKSSRGILLKSSIDGSEKWLSCDTANPVFKLNYY